MSHRALVAIALALVSVCVVTASGSRAHAGLVGGLTSLPRTGEVSLSDLQNGGFEIVDTVGGRLLPRNWTPAPGFDGAWSADSSQHNSGQYSMKMLGIAGAEAYQVVYLPAGTYTLTGYIKTSTSGSGRARLMMDLRTWRYLDVTGCVADCGVNFWTTSEELSASRTGTFQRVTTTITITDDEIAASRPSQPGRIKVFAVLDGYYASNRLTAWYDDVKISYQPAFPLDVFMQYPNYRGVVFTDQDETLRFRVAVNAVPPAGSAYTLQGTLRREGSDVVETVSRTIDASAIDPGTGKAAVVVTLNNSGGSGRPMGSATGVAYLAQFSLLDGNNNELTPRHPAHRVYRADRAGMKVSFDDKNHIVLDGQPRFILGVYDSGLGSVSTSTDWDNLLWDPTGARRMTGLPIDMYLNYHLGDTDAPVIDALMDHLSPETHGPAPGWPAPGQTGPWVNPGGTHYLQTGNCFSNFSAASHNSGAGFKIDQTDGYITDPAPNGIGGKALGYYTADECTPDMVDGVFQQYQRLVSLDPDSMTFGALLGDSSLGRWRDAIDVLSTDPYPLYGAEPAGGYNHGQVAAWTALTRAVVQDSRPFMTVLQFFKFDASRNSPGRWPTKQEMRNHAYMAIVEGARGLAWWSLGENALASMCKSGGWCTDRVQKMQDLRDVATEIASLETPLLASDVTDWGTVSGTAIKTKVKRIGGVDYLFTYNSTNSSTHADFALATVRTSVEAYGEGGRMLSPTPSGSGSTFGDDFGPFQAHVYIVR